MKQKQYNPSFSVQPWQLRQRQSLPLDCKVNLTLSRIKQWYERHNGYVFVSFSGGKDSTVLLHLVRSLYPKTRGVFVNTGLEYPEIIDFVKKQKNIEIIRPNITFREVIRRHGYPVVNKTVAATVHKLTQLNLSERHRKKLLYGDERGSFGKLPKKWRPLLKAPFKISDKCCEIMKHRPIRAYYVKTGNAPFVGTMAADSNLREMNYYRKGCFRASKHIPQCTPLAFWRQDDIWQYIVDYNLKYCSIYDQGIKHTGCIYCLFGNVYESEPDRFDELKKTHPRLYHYCMDNLKIRRVKKYVQMCHEGKIK